MTAVAEPVLLPGRQVHTLQTLLGTVLLALLDEVKEHHYLDPAKADGPIKRVGYVKTVQAMDAVRIDDIVKALVTGIRKHKLTRFSAAPLPKGVEAYRASKHGLIVRGVASFDIETLHWTVRIDVEGRPAVAKRKEKAKR